MASEKQHWANIRNAAKSTGPKTESGKLQSRRNAMLHGLTARTVVTAIEDTQEFESFAAAIGADYQPTSAIEHELIARLTSLLWRLRRSTLIETSLFELQGRLAADHKSECRATPDDARPELDMFYRLLRGPATLVPSQSDPNPIKFTKHGADTPTSGEITERHPNSAVIFLRLCNLNSFRSSASIDTKQPYGGRPCKRCSFSIAARSGCLPFSLRALRPSHEWVRFVIRIVFHYAFRFLEIITLPNTDPPWHVQRSTDRCCR